MPLICGMLKTPELTCSPVVTVTVGDREEGGIEDTKVHREGAYDVLTVIMFSAASICMHKHT